MGKGDGRRVEDRAKIDANWDRTFGRQPAEEDMSEAGEILVNYDEYRALVRDAQFKRRYARRYPTLYPYMVELLTPDGE